MALPQKIQVNAITGASLPSTIDGDLNTGIKQPVIDIFGIPDNTNISAAGLNFVAAGLDRVIFQDAAANPTATGRLQRNAANLLFHDGTAARTLVNLETAQVFSGALTLNGITTLGANITRAADQTVDLTGGATRTLTLQNSTGGQVANIDVDGTLLFRNNTAFTMALSGTPTANRTLTFPDVTDTVVLLGATQTLTSKTLTSPVLNTSVSGTAVLDEDNMASDSATQVATQQSIKAYVDSTRPVLGTPTATTSGTSHDYTGLPASIKRITITFTGVSTSGTSDIIIQIGDSGGLHTGADYFGAASTSGGTATGFTNGFIIEPAAAAAGQISGAMVLTLERTGGGTDRWVEHSIVGRVDAAGVRYGAGQITIDTAITQLRLTTAGGVNTFDSGEFNILYEV